MSLHHLDYVDSLFPYKTQADSLWTLGLAYRLDPPRILQQSFCYDYKRKWSISVAWGYSVQLYPFLLPANNLQTPLQTFKTWRTESDGPFTFNTQPLKSNPCEHPVLFMLNQAKKVGETGSLTSYERLEPRPEKMCNRTDYEEARSLQRVIVSALKLDPEYWTKVSLYISVSQFGSMHVHACSQVFMLIHTLALWLMLIIELHEHPLYHFFFLWDVIIGSGKAKTVL